LQKTTPKGKGKELCHMQFRYNKVVKPSEFETLNHDLITCTQCLRLTAWREEMAMIKRRAYIDQDYWGKPVPGFGDPLAKVLIVGLAPGAHGSNRTGRMFTGDASGDFLFPALYQAGFASQPGSLSREDGLSLTDVFISAVCRCAPPGNRPDRQEIANCLPWLSKEIALLENLQGLVALGRIAYDGIRQLYHDQLDLPKNGFAHGSLHRMKIGKPWVLCSYHPSRQNTQTGRLTVPMFDQVWDQVRALINQ
jgi:uracil-DNA glycosylase family 4